MIKRKKIIVLSGSPRDQMPREAAEKVCFEVLKELSKNKTLDLKFIGINEENIGSEEHINDLHLLRDVTDLGYFKVKQRSFWVSFLYLRVVFSYVVNLELNRIIQSENPDVLVTVWSEVGMRYVSNLRIKARKIALAGNLDHLVFSANKMSIQNSFHRHKFELSLRHKLKAFLLKKSVFKQLKAFQHVFNPAFNDTITLSGQGINSSYLPVIWPNENKVGLQRKNKHSKTIDIVLSVGKIDNTANNIVQKIFLDKIAPHLDKYPKNTFKFHIFGGGEIRSPDQKQRLLSNDVIIHGFVDDIDAELQKMDVALLLNGLSAFKVAHTRILHYWNLNLPVVAFEDIKMSMPEVMNGLNAVLFSNEKAALEAALILNRNKEYQNFITKNGRTTLQQSFNANRVLNAVLGQI